MMPRRWMILAVLLTASTCRAGSGKDGFQFLKPSVSPRQSAMGGVGVSFADDVNAVGWNPGALGVLRVDEFSFSYATYFKAATLGEIACAHPVGVGGIAGVLRALDYGDVDGYDAQGYKTSSYKAQDVSVSAAYGRPWTPSLSWGLAVKQVSESIAGKSGSVMAIDAGVFYRAPEGALSYGASLRNVGGKASFDKEPTSLPRLVAAGVSHHAFSEASITTLEGVRSSDGESSVSIGQELWMYNLMAFRAGYQSGRDSGSGFSLGMGFRFHTVRVDYSFVGNTASMEDTHRIGLVFRFGGAKDRLYQEALSLQRKGLNAEAILKLKEVLDVDPSHKGAIRALKDAVRALTEEREKSAPAPASREDD